MSATTRIAIILTDGRVEVNPAVTARAGGSGREHRVTVAAACLWLGWLALATGCAIAPAAGPAPSPSVLYIGQEPHRWEALVAANPLGPDENIKGIELSQRPAVSHFLVQIREREQPHLHRQHDATITMLRGEGRLVLNEQVLHLQTGDVIFIPRGTAHYYVNEGSTPTVVLAVFTPAYDGTDAVVVPGDP